MKRSRGLGRDQRPRSEIEEAGLKLATPVERDAAECQRAWADDHEAARIDPAANAVEGQTCRAGLLSREHLSLSPGEGGESSVGIVHGRQHDVTVSHHPDYREPVTNTPGFREYS